MTKLQWLAACLLACAGVSAQAQDFPSRPLRLVTIFAPGSASDQHGRYIAAKFTQELGQPVVVENKPGAGGLIGMRDVLRAQPLGYSVLYTTPALVGNLFAYKDPQYRIEDFTAVGPFWTNAYAMLVHNSVPVKTLPEFIAYAKKNPGKLNYGSLGLSSGSTIGAERLKQSAGIDMQLVPYKGGEPVAVALLAGEVQVYFGSIGVAKVRMKNPQIMGLAVTGDKRSPSLPDVPTFRELGHPSVMMTLWTASFVPTAAPRPAIQRLQTAMARINALPETKSLIEKFDSEQWQGTLEEFAASVRAEHAALGADYKRLNIQAQD